MTSQRRCLGINDILSHHVLSPQEIAPGMRTRAYADATVQREFLALATLHQELRSTQVRTRRRYVFAPSPGDDGEQGFELPTIERLHLVLRAVDAYVLGQRDAERDPSTAAYYLHTLDTLAYPQCAALVRATGTAVRQSLTTRLATLAPWRDAEYLTLDETTRVDVVLQDIFLDVSQPHFRLSAFLRGEWEVQSAEPYVEALMQVAREQHAQAWFYRTLGYLLDHVRDGRTTDTATSEVSLALTDRDIDHIVSVICGMLAKAPREWRASTPSALTARLMTSRHAELRHHALFSLVSETAEPSQPASGGSIPKTRVDATVAAQPSRSRA